MPKMPFVRVALLGALLAVLLLGSRPLFAADPQIVGSSRFKSQIQKALLLLKTRDKRAYAIITENVGRIQEGERSGMWADKTPPTYEVSDKTAFASLTWCAATIAHDSFHSKLYHDYRKAHKKAPKVPGDVWTGNKAERQCMTHQIAVMKAIGAPASEIDYALKMSDGRYVKNAASWAEYKNRKW